MKRIKKLPDTISVMLVFLIGFMILAIFAFFGSINLYLTLVVIAVLSIICISFCMGAHIERKEREQM